MVLDCVQSVYVAIAVRRAPGDQKDAELRVAGNAPSSMDCADQSGAGIGCAVACVEWCWIRRALLRGKKERQGIFFN